MYKQETYGQTYGQIYAILFVNDNNMNFTSVTKYASFGGSQQTSVGYI